MSAGTPIGAVGNTGRSYGAHLHFSVLIDGEFADPIAYLRARGLDLCTLPISGSHTTANTCK